MPSSILGKIRIKSSKRPKILKQHSSLCVRSMTLKNYFEGRKLLRAYLKFEFKANTYGQIQKNPSSEINYTSVKYKPVE